MYKASTNDGYVKHFHDNKVMSFKITDKKLLNKYNKIWEKLKSY